MNAEKAKAIATKVAMDRVTTWWNEVEQTIRKDIELAASKGMFSVDIRLKKIWPAHISNYSMYSELIPHMVKVLNSDGFRLTDVYDYDEFRTHIRIEWGEE